MIQRIKPCPVLEGEITPPGDKSISHRAVILNSIAKGRARISNLAPGADCLSTINCLRALGVEMRRQKASALSPSLIVWGRGERGLSEAEDVLNAGNSATTMRLLSGLLAAQPFFTVITGDASLRSRPMKRLIEPLRLMGADIWGRGNDSLAPLAIRGKELQGISYSLPVASAQLKSALLLAALFGRGKTAIQEPAFSRDHTERLLAEMGCNLERDGTSITLTPLSLPLPTLDVCVPGDISAAAYWLVAGAIHPRAQIRVRNCGINPTRSGVIDALLAMGAKLQIEKQWTEGGEPVADLFIQSSELKGIEIGGEMIPRLIDEVPVLAVAASLAKGSTTIKDAGELRVKESDRIRTTTLELCKLGVVIEELPQGMVVHGGGQLRGAEVDSHLDHRLAMSLAIAGLVAQGETTIHGAQAVEVSYPGFWQHMKSLTR